MKAVFLTVVAAVLSKSKVLCSNWTCSFLRKQFPERQPFMNRGADKIRRF